MFYLSNFLKKVLSKVQLLKEEFILIGWKLGIL